LDPGTVVVAEVTDPLGDVLQVVAGHLKAVEHRVAVGEARLRLAPQIEHHLQQVAMVGGEPLSRAGHPRRQRLEQQPELLLPTGAVGRHARVDGSLPPEGLAMTRSRTGGDSWGTLWASPACTRTGCLAVDFSRMRTLVPRSRTSSTWVP